MFKISHCPFLKKIYQFCLDVRVKLRIIQLFQGHKLQSIAISDSFSLFPFISISCQELTVLVDQTPHQTAPPVPFPCPLLSLSAKYFGIG